MQVADDDGTVVVKKINWTATGSGFPSRVINALAEHETTVHSVSVAVSGSTSGSGVGVLVSSDQGYAEMANGTTAWNANVPLKSGLNRILVQATDANGRVVSVEHLVHYVPNEPLRVSGMTESSASVECWEMLVNEEAPGPGAHFQFTADLAARAGADGNPHLATTSTWATLAAKAWKDPASALIPCTDFHA